MATLKQHKQLGIGCQQASRNIFEEGFEFMGKVANGGNLNHPRPTFEGMQVPQQVFNLEVILGVGLPAR